MEWVHPRRAGSDAWALSSPPYAGSKVKGGGVRFAPSQVTEGAHGHVHFDEKLHDSAVMVTQEKDGSFLVKVGAVTQGMVVAGGGVSQYHPGLSLHVAAGLRPSWGPCGVGVPPSAACCSRLNCGAQGTCGFCCLQLCLLRGGFYRCTSGHCSISVTVLRFEGVSRPVSSLVYLGGPGSTLRTKVLPHGGAVMLLRAQV